MALLFFLLLPRLEATTTSFFSFSRLLLFYSLSLSLFRPPCPCVFLLVCLTSVSLLSLPSVRPYFPLLLSLPFFSVSPLFILLSSLCFPPVFSSITPLCFFSYYSPLSLMFSSLRSPSLCFSPPLLFSPVPFCPPYFSFCTLVFFFLSLLFSLSFPPCLLAFFGFYKARECHAMVSLVTVGVSFVDI